MTLLDPQELILNNSEHEICREHEFKSKSQLVGFMLKPVYQIHKSLFSIHDLCLNNTCARSRAN